MTDIHEKEMPEVDSNHTCLAVMTIDFALKNYRIMGKCF